MMCKQTLSINREKIKYSHSSLDGVQANAIHKQREKKSILIPALVMCKQTLSINRKEKKSIPIPLLVLCKQTLSRNREKIKYSHSFFADKVDANCKHGRGEGGADPRG